MAVFFVGDTSKDLLCLMYILDKYYNVKEVPRVDLAGITQYSMVTIKRYMKKWVEQGIIDEKDVRGKVLYTLNESLFLSYNNIITYCESRKEELTRLIERYITEKGRIPYSILEERQNHENITMISSDLIRKERLHEKIKDILYRLGKAFGYDAKKEYEFYECKARYDVVWLKSGIIKKVFEVQHHGNIRDAMFDLECIYDKRNAESFLVVLGKKQYEEAIELKSARESKFYRLLKIIDGEKILRLTDEVIEVIREIML